MSSRSLIEAAGASTDRHMFPPVVPFGVHLPVNEKFTNQVGRYFRAVCRPRSISTCLFVSRDYPRHRASCRTRLGLKPRTRYKEQGYRAEGRLRCLR